MALNYDAVMSRRFPPRERRYGPDEMVRFARGFGAGLPGALAGDDAAYLGNPPERVLPMSAIALCDGEFWQQDPAMGIDWRKIVHAEEALTLHGPLAAEGCVTVNERILALFDRGAARGAVMKMEQTVGDDAGGLLARIEVTTVLKGDGGFGGEAEPPAAPWGPPEGAAPDATLDIPTPVDGDTAFRLAIALDVAGTGPDGKPRQMIRGVGCFGLAGRGILHLLCGNRPERLRRLRVRYAGPVFTGETMRLDVWHGTPGRATFRLSAVERGAPVLSRGEVEYLPQAAAADRVLQMPTAV